MTYQNKNRILAFAFIVVLIIAYQATISKTVTIRKEVKGLENRSTSLLNKGVLAYDAKGREDEIDSILNRHDLQNSSIQNKLLEVLNSEAENEKFSISNFNSPHTFEEDLTTITSYSFTLEGDFSSILDIIYTLEQRYNFGKVIHVNFEVKNDYRKRKKFLTSTVIIERLGSDE